jgi:VWFA-related protein
VAPAADISVDVRLAILNVSVRDKKGGTVPQLERRNFIVEEDGTLQTIQTFQHEDVPVSIGLIVDNSGSMNTKRPEVIAAGLAFVRLSNPGDDMFVINFNERVTFGLPDTKLFSASDTELEAALLKRSPAGKTALYDAIGEALTHIEKSALDRKVLVVITDGGDNASKLTLNQVLEQVKRSNVMIYTIGLFDGEDDPDRNPRALRQIAGASGGAAFLPKTPTEAVSICKRIAREIRDQYTVTYSPSNQTLDGGYRTINVRLTGGHTANLQVRTRPGYIASPR